MTDEEFRGDLELDVEVQVMNCKQLASLFRVQVMIPGPGGQSGLCNEISIILRKLEFVIKLQSKLLALAQLLTQTARSLSCHLSEKASLEYSVLVRRISVGLQHLFVES